MKNFLKNIKYVKRILVLAISIILVVTLTGSPGLRIAQAGDEAADKAGAISGEKGDDSAAGQASGKISGIPGVSQEAEEAGKADSQLNQELPQEQKIPQADGQVTVQSQDASHQPAGQDRTDEDSKDKPQAGGQGTAAKPQAGSQDKTDQGTGNKPQADSQDKTSPGAADKPQADSQDKTDQSTADKTPPDSQDKEGEGTKEKPAADGQTGSNANGGNAADQLKPSLDLQKRLDKIRKDLSLNGESAEAKTFAVEGLAAPRAVKGLGTYDISVSGIAIKDGPAGQLLIDYNKNTYTESSAAAITITGTYNGQTKGSNNVITVNAPNASKAEKGLKLVFDNLNLLSYTQVKESGQIVGTPKSAVAIAAGSGAIVTLKGKNTVIAKTALKSCINVPGGAGLVIRGDGSLDAQCITGITANTGISTGAGIGGDFAGTGTPSLADSGTIIIESGTVSATGENAPGIGAGQNGIAHNITIKGGTVVATAGQSNQTSAIGNTGFSGSAPESTWGRVSDQNITITGGTVHATGKSSSAASIGGGAYSGGGHITISGGLVMVDGKGTYGIGKGHMPSGRDVGTDLFSTGTNGSPIILLQNTKSGGGGSGFISDGAPERKRLWQGVIFESSIGRVYQNPTIDRDLQIPVGYKLYVGYPKGESGEGAASVTNYEGVALDVYGQLINYGTVQGNMKMTIKPGGLVNNFGLAQSSGSLKIEAGGVMNNGSNEEREEAHFDNLPGSTLVVDGTLNNYARTTKAADVSLTGGGHIWNLPDLQIKVFDKAGHEIKPGTDGIVKLSYDENISVQGNIAGPAAGAIGDWTASVSTTLPRPHMGFSLSNPDELPAMSFYDTPVPDTAASTAGTSEKIDVGHQVHWDSKIIALPWEGDRPPESPLKFQIKVEGMGGGPSAVPGQPSVGYLTDEAYLPVGYDKLELNPTFPNHFTGALGQPIVDGAEVLGNLKWSGQAQDPKIPGTFQWKDPAQSVVYADPLNEYIMNYVPSDPYDIRNYRTASKGIQVPVVPVSRTITYDPQSGSFPGMSPGEVKKMELYNGTLIGEDKRPNPPPIKAGAQFVDWYKDAACTQIWDFAKDKVTADMTLYARYVLTEPSLGFVIPTKLDLTNDPDGEAKVQGTIQVKKLNSGENAGLHYPYKVKVSTAEDVPLTGSKGLSRKAMVYMGDGTTPYPGGTPLMTFDFKSSPVQDEKHSFWLKMAKDDPERLPDTYKGSMTLTFDTTANPPPAP